MRRFDTLAKALMYAADDIKRDEDGKFAATGSSGGEGEKKGTGPLGGTRAPLTPQEELERERRHRSGADNRAVKALGEDVYLKAKSLGFVSEPWDLNAAGERPIYGTTRERHALRQMRVMLVQKSAP